MPALYLLRHARAAPAGEAGVARDADRPLSDEGRELTRRGAEGMKRLGLSFDRVLASPYLRARETAGIVASVLGLEKRLSTLEELAAGAHWPRVRRALQGSDGLQSILLVGHEPDMSRMVAALTGADRALVAFGTGTLAALDVDRIPPASPAVLKFLLRSDVLAALSR